MKYRIIPVTPYQQNCSLIWCQHTHHGALIDPGGEADRLLRAARTEGVQLQMLLLTHGHWDHVGAAQEIAEQLGIPIIGPHQEDAFWLERLPRQTEMLGFAPLQAFIPDRWLTDGATVRLGKITLDVLHCPGHTPGHVVFFHAGSHTAFVGDVLFQGSIGRTDFPRGDHAALIHSIMDKLLPLGDDITVIPGHGPHTTLGEERLHNPFLIKIK
ncbi:MAG: hypothetical protein A2V90_04210 [Gammaproteobacteria bacterium RBG_16_57_12]|nr:MAG: hypothetical protein A2V90_04210 [Gammaproteobacteria bacterium RBG_16_57_12]